MHIPLRTSAVVVLAVGLAAVCGPAHAGAEGSHESKPEIDCRKNSYGNAAILSPTFNYNTTDQSATTCYANDQARHIATNTVRGLLNDAL
ncbi:hypothetical protein [Streptomyces flavidovirens]|uniref:Secreted protein n=1 Tax=Streptomyces flavidovirens TaxID=67298 RepID=A0ABW6RRR3_9ACTN